MKKQILLSMAAFYAAVLFSVMNPDESRARDPFRSPAPSADMYDYQAAVGEIQLRGLFVTSAGSRAVIYHYKDDIVQVVSPSDEVIINLEGLKHKYTVAGIGGRSLSLTGSDSKTYRIGIEERGNKK